MRKRGTHQGDAADVNVTPLLDIVFIMLIFFIVTATFLREKGVDLSTPDPSPDQDESVPPPSLVLAVQEDGFVRVNNVRLIDPQSVTPVVEEFAAREPEGVVLINAAPDAESGVTVTVLDQVRDGGMQGRVSVTLQSE